MRDKGLGIAIALGIIGAVFAFAFITNGVLGGQPVASTDVTVRTADPTVDDDIDRGFLPGYQWVNQSNQTIYGVVSTGDGAADWDQLNGGGSGGGHVIQEEGSDLAQRANLNFVGAGIFCDDTGVDTTTCTIGSAVHEFGVLFTDDTAPDAQVLATAGVFEVIDEFDSEGVSSSGVTVNTGSNSITIDNAGIYAVGYSASYLGSASREFDLQIFIDGVGESASITHRSLSAAGSIGVAASGTIIVGMTGGEVVDLRAAPETNGDSITVFNGSLIINEIQDFGADELPTLADDNVWTGNSSNVATAVAIPDCNASNIDRLQYDVTTNAWSCQNAAIDVTSEITGIVPIANGGTGQVSGTEDGVLIGDTSAFIVKVLPDCQDTGGNHLNYNNTSDAFSCGTSIRAVDISDDTNLAGGTNITLSGDTLNVDDAFLLNDGDVGTGVFDFGGADSLEIPNGAGGTTVNATGEVTIDSTLEALNFYDGTQERTLVPERSVTITVENPDGSEDISIFRAEMAITVIWEECVLTGSATPSITSTLRHGTDRSASGAELVTGGNTTTSTTSGDRDTTFNDATVVADSFLWWETTAQSGTVDSSNCTWGFNIDP